MAASASAVPSFLDPDATARVATWLDEQIARNRIAGACIGVVRGDEQFLVSAGHQRVPAPATDGDTATDTPPPVTPDTIFRIYSMTKAVVSCAIMMLCERGLMDLDSPVAQFIPSFAEMHVAVGGAHPALETQPARTRITIHHLLTHTSGLTASFFPDDMGVNLAYRDAGVDFNRLDTNTDASPPGTTHDTGNTARPSPALHAMVDRLARMPLLFEPGTQWRYSNATDVLGCVVEVVSGVPLPEFLQREIFLPLGMHDTAFYVPETKRSRFATCYTIPGGLSASLDVTAAFRTEGGLLPMPLDECYFAPPPIPDGGGGLVSTLRDYLAFCRMLLARGAIPADVGAETREGLQSDSKREGAADVVMTAAAQVTPSHETADEPAAQTVAHAVRTAQTAASTAAAAAQQASLAAQQAAVAAHEAARTAQGAATAAHQAATAAQEASARAFASSSGSESAVTKDALAQAVEQAQAAAETATAAAASLTNSAGPSIPAVSSSSSPAASSLPFRRRRLLGRKTVEAMMTNQLEGDIADNGLPLFFNLNMRGIGFGLGFSVILDPARSRLVCSKGECAWGGMASTFFWIDPAEEVACVFLTQIVPSSAYPFRRQLRSLVNAALV